MLLNERASAENAFNQRTWLKCFQVGKIADEPEERRLHDAAASLLGRGGLSHDRATGLLGVAWLYHDSAASLLWVLWLRHDRAPSLLGGGGLLSVLGGRHGVWGWGLEEEVCKFE